MHENWFVCVSICVHVVGITRCQFHCCPRPGGVTAGLGTPMRSESVRKGGSKSRSACCRYTVGLRERSMGHESARSGQRLHFSTSPLLSDPVTYLGFWKDLFPH